MLARIIQFSFIIIPLFLSTLALASDQAKEKRWASQIEDTLMDGESLMLQAKTSSFYALYNKTQQPNDTAIILLHGLGIHPDWPQVINPLRIALPEKGWTVLSLQLPILANGASGREYLALYKDVPERINAGISYLQQQGIKKVVLVAHSLGTEMAGYTLTQANKNKAIVGFIGIGMGSDNIEYLSKITLPIMDLYGEEDLKGIIASAKNRMQAASGNKRYSQLRVSNADHFFDGEEKVLIKQVLNWLEKQAF
jgi:pimeloyl-ACP methyl ester carboxylesterase